MVGAPLNPLKDLSFSATPPQKSRVVKRATSEQENGLSYPIWQPCIVTPQPIMYGCDSLLLLVIWGFPQIRGTSLGVPIIRIIVFWGLYWGPPILGNYHMVVSRGRRPRLTTVTYFTILSLGARREGSPRASISFVQPLFFSTGGCNSYANIGDYRGPWQDNADKVRGWLRVGSVTEQPTAI